MPLLDTLKFVINHPINRTQRARALYRFVKWQVGGRLVPGPVVVDWINGSRFIVTRGETGLTGNLYCGLHEFNEMAYVLHVLGPEDCFVDIGANVGSYTLLACAARGARGHCFEPVPATFTRLMDNLRLNDLLHRVAAHNMGVSDATGELKFSIGENCGNHVLADCEVNSPFAPVRVESLDSMLGGDAASLIKIDVEGFETPVIRGARGILSNKCLHSVIMELNGSGKRYGYDDADLVEEMKALDFIECQYDPVARQLRVSESNVRSTENSIFIRDIDQVRLRIMKAPKFSIYGQEF